MNSAEPSGTEILIVDDDAEIRSVLRDLLKGHGFSVAEAADGRAALDFLTDGHRPSLVIMDLEMPVMTGLELLEIMKNYERLSSLPVMILSGSAKAPIPVAEPVVRYFQKPLRADLLITAVKQYTQH